MTNEIERVEMLPGKFDWASAARKAKAEPREWHRVRRGRLSALNAAATRMRRSENREMPKSQGWKISVRKLKGAPAAESHGLFVMFDPDGAL